MASARYGKRTDSYSVDKWVAFVEMANASIDVDVNHDVDVGYGYNVNMAAIDRIFAMIDDMGDDI